MKDFVVEYGYLDFISYVVKMGCMWFVEIYILIYLDMVIGIIGSVDVLCDEIVVCLDVCGSEFWLIIDFIVDLVWI